MGQAFENRHREKQTRPHIWVFAYCEGVWGNSVPPTFLVVLEGLRGEEKQRGSISGVGRGGEMAPPGAGLRVQGPLLPEGALRGNGHHIPHLAHA